MHQFSMSQLKPGAHIHMIGIGGISMSALAHMLLDFGYQISGSDSKASALTDSLSALGASIQIGQSAENIQNPDLVCYTAAISESNPELRKARTLNIPVIERAELLGALMELYKYPIAVAGTHGKTTTTSMLSLVLLAADTDPTILVGGELPQIGGNFRLGSKNYLPFEACEYVESFLHFKPFLSIITNVEEDHLDYFSDINHIISSFQKFARLTSPNGCIIVCSDDKNLQKVVQNVDKKIIFYGLDDKNTDFTAQNIKINQDGFPEFTIIKQGLPLVDISLRVAGEHNILNSLAVTAAADFLGLPISAVKEGLESFTGTKRRFEHIGTVNGCDIVDDYAHHPTEIKVTLHAAQQMHYNDIWVVFQPHTYSRTKSLLHEFAEALPIADHVIITDVYPARETYDGTIHACDLAALIPGSIYMNDMDAITRYLKQNLQKGDLIITMGAGDVNKIAQKLKETELQ
ncbi:UDP-N-acetylmuramate--L-alanine ligase [Ructibacterium gallinarum]|uniref:UDP-N-acetylmuramate--L-alanine ligase n=1 Tax=Ructibacterium gallinarum TaxID=2779355 RepID=A0A9D5M4I2_9FIRM|nr:UDP-N-acetylmuramate--L-alanine ligase [Ructibacterium gallinarum]MBE5040460.1 UDP-N-acetylmuramate--L-alanine ligase [Ructibacterium gallinarum]